jgi:hypothetical protein
MDSALGSLHPSVAEASPNAKPGLSLFRLYTLRLAYLVLAVGLGLMIWPVVISHTPAFALAHGVQAALLAAIGLTAVLGIRYPVQMLPLLIFEFTWKAIYLVAFALPLWRAHQITPAAAADIQAVIMIVIFVPLIPWIYIWKNYAMKPGERWR